MGHEHHFLSRLDRVSLPHVERALALYRDHHLVRFLLGHLSLPEGAERVAISLDDPERGPFLIVTREGHFVTCLGEGMRPGRLPIVTRERLDGITAKHSDLQARLQAGRAFGGTRRLLVRLYDAGEDLSREEIIAVSGVAPLLRRELLEFLGRAHTTLDAARGSIFRILKRTERPKGPWRELLSAYHKTLWCALHMTVLLAAVSRDVFERVEDGARRKLGTWLTAPLFEHAIDAHAARAVWSAGKLGRSLLQNYKEAWAEATTMMQVLESALVLAQIGLRHARARAEVQKVIAAMPPRFGRDGAHPATRQVAQGVVELSAIAFGNPASLTESTRRHGARHAIRIGEDLPPGHRYRFTRSEDVPDAIALPLAVNQGACYLSNPSKVSSLFLALPWMARAKVEDLYLPRDYVEEVTASPWCPDDTLRLFRPEAELRRAIRRTRPESPTRNGPCPCGSGKKYKRCCGEAA